MLGQHCGEDLGPVLTADDDELVGVGEPVARNPTQVSDCDGAGLNFISWPDRRDDA